MVEKNNIRLRCALPLIWQKPHGPSPLILKPCASINQLLWLNQLG